ncbi:tyrosine-type recombinase/integrase [Streptomyces hygroscopicus]|uniref:tyrosine-type recombinase/integrase n=1 Tax=Streptomyces hygroscopicus TaxID=1912 RepID=UPI003408132D
MARRATNNPRQMRSKTCGCKLCLAEYPPEQHGERRPRRDCIGSWQARYRDSAGKQKARNFKKKGEADAFLDAVKTAVRNRTYHDPTRGKITLSAWWELWWPAQSKKGRPTTRNRKLSLWGHHIEPKWGGHKLIDLEFMELQTWLSEEVLGHATQVKVLQLLRRLLADAVRDGKRILFNPAAELEVTAEAPAKHPDDLRPPTEEQYALIREQLPPYYRQFADFAQETGMRFGEWTALRRCHYDREGRTVKVKEVVIDDHGRLRRQAAPKTSAGFRTVPLTDKAVEAVEVMIQRWDQAATESPIGDGTDMHPEEIIFRGPGGGVLNRNNFRRVWIPAIQDAGLARKVKNEETGRLEWWPRVHDYRHALASRLHAAGVPEKDVQLILGQKRGGRVTWNYTHGSEDSVETVRAALEGKPQRKLRAVS